MGLEYAPPPYTDDDGRLLGRVRDCEEGGVNTNGGRVREGSLNRLELMLVLLVLGRVLESL